MQNESNGRNDKEQKHGRNERKEDKTRKKKKKEHTDKQKSEKRTGRNETKSKSDAKEPKSLNELEVYTARFNDQVQILNEKMDLVNRRDELLVEQIKANKVQTKNVTNKKEFE